MLIAVEAGPAESACIGPGTGSADVLPVTVKPECTYIVGFTKSTSLLKGSVITDLSGNSGAISVKVCSDCGKSFLVISFEAMVIFKNGLSGGVNSHLVF